MSEQINKVLASTAQAFTTAEQKQARDNIGAMAAGDMSAYLPFSAISADAGSAITSINGSSVGNFTGVSSNNNVTGNGTSGSPVGLSAQISAVSSRSTSSATSYFNGFGMDGTADPYTSCRYWVGGWSIYTNGDATHHHSVDGNASGINLSWNTNFYWSNIHASGINQKDAWSPSMNSAEWSYTGATLKTYTGASAIFKASGITLWNSASGSGRKVGIDDIDRWNSFTAGASPNTNNGVTGDGTLVSPIGLSSRIEFPSATSGAAVGHRGMTVSSTNHTSWYYGAFASFEKASATANYRASEAEFIDSNGTAVVNKSSIDRWNSYSGGSWNESGNSLSTGYGGFQVSAASQYNETGNWAARTVSISGSPDQTMYGFQSKPNGTATYGINRLGAFVQIPQQNYFTYLFHVTGAVGYQFDNEIFPTGLTADARLDFVNLCSAASANICTDTFHGTTATIDPGQSATMWYIATAGIWTNGENPVPV